MSYLKFDLIQVVFAFPKAEVGNYFIGLDHVERRLLCFYLSHHRVFCRKSKAISCYELWIIFETMSILNPIFKDDQASENDVNYAKLRRKAIIL